MRDLAVVRAAFPALASGFVFLDNAGGSQTLGEVAERVRDYLLHTNVQLGASDPSEVVFGTSTTQLLANLSAAMESTLAVGDEIVVSDADHQANVGPWTRLARRGVVIRRWRLDPVTL